MGNKMTPLQALKKVKQARYFVDFELDAKVGEDYKEELKIIETALKEKEQQDNVLKILKEVIEFAAVLPEVKPTKDDLFNVVSVVSINTQRTIENKERELLRQWVLDTCFPKELKEYEELLKIEYKQNTINDFYPNTRKMINDLLDLLTTKMCDFLKDGETYTKTNLLETMGFAVRYVKTFAYGQEFNETEKVGVNAKKLKVLEIVKDKRVDLGAFVRDFVEGTDAYNEYYEDIDEYHYYRKGDHETPILTQEEFDLLKEVLL